MAHKKGVGSSKNGRDSASQRLGVKIWGGQKVIAGNIIIRQRGNKHFAGENVAQGKDDTLYALTDGLVYFHKGKKDKSTVSVLSPELYAAKTKVEAYIIKHLFQTNNRMATPMELAFLRYNKMKILNDIIKSHYFITQTY